MHDLSRSFSAFFKFGFPSDSWGRQFASKLPVYCLGLLMSWMDQILVRLFSYIGMAFAFRATTLHLRQVDAPPSPHRLTIRSLLWLTTLVAIWLSSGAIFNTIGSMAGLVVEQQASNPRRVCLHILNEMATAMLWFSIAWIYVAHNSRRWIGGLGVLTYAAFLVLDYFIPMFGVYYVGIDTTYRMGLLVISILNVGIAFLCVGMMHIAGYRWDFYGSDYRTTSPDPA